MEIYLLRRHTCFVNGNNTYFPILRFKCYLKNNALNCNSFFSLSHNVRHIITGTSTGDSNMLSLKKMLKRRFFFSICPDQQYITTAALGETTNRGTRYDLNT